MRINPFHLPITIIIITIIVIICYSLFKDAEADSD